ncbi:MAG: hypothetical protein NTV97_26830 [Alphaproteobacteria bacterium]|nr:hypothetical protein [Alphaproteobacteria bacterium]
MLMIAVRTPRRSSRRMTSATLAAGTDASVTSTSSGNASMLATTARPAISAASAWTGITLPANL